MKKGQDPVLGHRSVLTFAVILIVLFVKGRSRIVLYQRWNCFGRGYANTLQPVCT